MDYTITIGEGLQILLGLALFVFIVYLIRAVKNFIPVIKSLNRILDDTQVLTGVVSKATKDVQGSISNICETTDEVSQVITGNQNVFTAIASVVNAGISLRNLFK